MKRVLLYIGIAIAAIGCTKEDSATSPGGAVQFNAGVTTRVADTNDCAWKEGDEIGIFTDQSGEENMKFTISNATTGAMTADASVEQLYTLPSGVRSYIAYHPFKDLASGTTTIAVDATVDYSTPLLWGAVTTNDAEVTIPFAHKLAKVTFNLTAGGEEVTSLSGTEVTVTLKGANASATFDINDGTLSSEEVKDIPLTLDANGSVTLYLPPTAAVQDNVKLWIYAEGNTFLKTITTEKWEIGGSYEYNLTVGEIDIELNDDGIYYIYTAGGLFKFADLVNSGESTIKGTLVNDIDLKSAEWTPIGDDEKLYSGTFEGNNKTVSGLYINASSSEYQGLFGYTNETSEISNLGVDGSVNGSSNYVGGVVGYNRGTITNCYNLADVEGSENVGGVVGYTISSVTITNCYNLGSVNGQRLVGGVVGNNSGTLTNCYNSGNMEGKSYVGGVVGLNGSGTITKCYNSGSVNGTSDFVGGVVGFNSSGSGSITNCYNSGSVEGSDEVGGVVGCNYKTVANCYNSGSVEGSDNVGGVVGYNQNSTVTNCYNSGSVNGTSDVGGVVGDYYSSTITNCYYIADTTNSSTGAMTSTDMQAGSFVTTLNDNAETYNNESDPAPAVEACGWVDNSLTGYPTLDFDAEPTSN